MAVIAGVAIAAGAGSALAADGGATVEKFSVSFTLTSASCSNLPSGTTLTGSGTETSITRIMTAKDGTTTVSNTSVPQGAATDQGGNTYVFEYSNTFKVSNSAADPAVFTGQMNDSFSLGGGGPARLNDGFVAAVATDFATFFTFDPKVSRGDPIDFTTGAAHCDPL